MNERMKILKHGIPYFVQLKKNHLLKYGESFSLRLFLRIYMVLIQI